jgi:hypothetical protein
MGTISKTQRFEIFKLDSFTCQYCGGKSPDVTLEIDHIKPVSQGGLNKLINMVTACKSCNSSKGDSILEFFPDSIAEAILRRHDHLKNQQDANPPANQKLSKKTLKLFGEDVIVDKKTGMLNATKLISSINKANALALRPPYWTISAYFSKISTTEFIEELLKEYKPDDLVIKIEKNHWVHFFVFIDIALSTSSTLKFEVYNWIFNEIKNQTDYDINQILKIAISKAKA